MTSYVALIVSLLFSLLPDQLSGGLPQTQRDHRHQGKAHHRFDDAQRWAEVFENPVRDAWQKPAEVIAAMGIPPGAVVADIGSATGYFPVRFAKVAQRVYGIDVESDMVRYLNERAKKEGLTNLTSILGAFQDPRIPEAVDFIFICDTYHHIEQREQYFQDLKRYFRPRGRLVIVDFRKGDLPVGPPDSLKISRQQVLEELTALGYTLQSSDLKLPYQYFLILSPEEVSP